MCGKEIPENANVNSAINFMILWSWGVSQWTISENSLGKNGETTFNCVCFKFIPGTYFDDLFFDSRNLLHVPCSIKFMFISVSLFETRKLSFEVSHKNLKIWWVKFWHAKNFLKQEITEIVWHHCPNKQSLAFNRINHAECLQHSNLTLPLHTLKLAHSF